MADEPNIRTRGPLSTDKKMASLTRRQLDCLKFIRSFRDENGVTPTYREIIDALSLKSTSGAHRIVLALETRGHVYRRAGEARSITLVDDEGPSVSEALQIILGKCTLTTGTASELRALLGMERAG